MSIDIEKLELSVNLHSLQPDFLNSELHYVIAENENEFRFVAWDEEPTGSAEKFYCFLSDQELIIPAGNVVLKESYVIEREPLYPTISTYGDFITALESLKTSGVSKAVRRFHDDDIDAMKSKLQEKYGEVEKHVVTSSQGQHLLFLFDDIEISISATMVYFRYKTPFNKSHYEHVKEEQ